MPDDPRLAIWAYRGELQGRAEHLYFQKSDAEDAVQEVFAGALRDWASYTPGNLRAWLFQRLHWNFLLFLEHERSKKALAGRRALPLETQIDETPLAVAPRQDNVVLLSEARRFMQRHRNADAQVVVALVMGYSARAVGAQIGRNDLAVNQRACRYRRDLRQAGFGDD